MEKLKYCIKGKDTFVKFAESPVGTYYLNIDKRLVVFIASNNMSNEEAYEIDGFMANVGTAFQIENAKSIKFIQDTFIRLNLDKDWDPKTPVTYKIEGELKLTVSGKYGNLYADIENKRWYFEPSIKNFRNKLFNIFKESVAKDARISPKIENVLVIIKNWKEIDDDEIISN